MCCSVGGPAVGPGVLKAGVEAGTLLGGGSPRRSVVVFSGGYLKLINRFVVFCSVVVLSPPRRRCGVLKEVLKLVAEAGGGVGARGC